MIREAIHTVALGKALSFHDAQAVFNEVFDNKATHAQIAAFLALLAVKGEHEHEIAALASVIRARAHGLKVKGDFVGIELEDEAIVDTCGTGGSGVNKLNISTASAFVVASAGIKVAKHGNRAMSSNCGSADVLEAMGIKVEVSPAIMESAIKQVGIGFLFAPLYHPALKEVAGLRREIGIRTIFNLVGPLCNPAKATHQILGVHSKALVPIIARVLRTLGVKKAFVVHGEDLKDEISLSGKTTVAFLNDKKIKHIVLSPRDFGLKKVSVKSLEVTNCIEGAERIKDIFKGKRSSSRDVVLANSAACLFIAARVKTLKEGVRLAANLIEQGKVMEKFVAFKQFVDSHPQW